MSTMRALYDLHAAVRAHHHKTIREQRSPYGQGKAEGRVIGVALAMEEIIRQESKR